MHDADPQAHGDGGPPIKKAVLSNLSEFRNNEPVGIKPGNDPELGHTTQHSGKLKSSSGLLEISGPGPSLILAQDIS